MTPAHEEPLARIFHGDCVEVMQKLEADSVDAVVCDPPYGLEFMGKEWDAPWRAGAGLGGNTAGFSAVDMADGAARLPKPSYHGSPNPTCRNCGGMRRGREGKKSQPPCRCEAPRFDDVIGPRQRAYQEWSQQWAAAALRVLKPGGHCVAFGGPRTFHRLTCALEDAGFEIRDCLMFMYGSGFPKSRQVGCRCEAAKQTTERGVRSVQPTDEAERLLEPRPISEQRGAQAGGGICATCGGILGLTGYGTALKPSYEPIVLARKPLAERTVAANVLRYGTGAINVDACRIGTPESTARPSGVNGTVYGADERRGMIRGGSVGRWPANLVLDEDAAQLLDAASGERDGGGPARGGVYPGQDGGWPGGDRTVTGYRDTGGASRFFYTAKADREDRDGSKHPTVKPVDLMKWLIKLVTPPDGVVLDPFLGSGTTVFAARALGIRSIGIERETEYIADAVARLRQGVLL